MTDGITINTATALGLGAGALTVIAALFKMLMAAKDREHARLVADLTETKENFEKLAAESLVYATAQANFSLARANLPPIVPVAPVVPRSQSPTTPKQRETARLATMVATLEQLRLATGFAAQAIPQKAPQSATEHQKENELETLMKETVKVTSPAILANADLEKQIKAVPEKTATKVVEKIKASGGLKTP